MPSILMGLKKYSFLLLLLAIASCQTQDKMQRFQGDALGTSYNVRYFDTAPSERVSDSIDAVFLRMNQSMSTYWPNAIISKVNRDEPVTTDADFKKVFQTAKDIWQQTDGYFDPTVGALVNAYGFGPAKSLEQIDQATIDSLLKITGFDKVSLLPDGTIKKTHKNSYLDFNAIAKGYAVDALASMLQSLGYTQFLVEVGGELFASGLHPEKEKPWRVAIDHPKQDTARTFIATLPLQNQGLASSGNYRKFRMDASGKRYVHTVNPKTGETVQSNVLSTSVLAPSTMLADAYATALMAMPYEQGKTLISNLSAIEAMWVLAVNDSVQVVATPGFTYDLE
jgi:thiamine biosynthesis lipoprotein